MSIFPYLLHAASRCQHFTILLSRGVSTGHWAPQQNIDECISNMLFTATSRQCYEMGCRGNFILSWRKSVPEHEFKYVTWEQLFFLSATLTFFFMTYALWTLYTPDPCTVWVTYSWLLHSASYFFPIPAFCELFTPDPCTLCDAHSQSKADQAQFLI